MSKKRNGLFAGVRQILRAGFNNYVLAMSARVDRDLHPLSNGGMGKVNWATQDLGKVNRATHGFGLYEAGPGLIPNLEVVPPGRPESVSEKTRNVSVLRMDHGPGPTTHHSYLLKAGEEIGVIDAINAGRPGLHSAVAQQKLESVDAEGREALKPADACRITNGEMEEDIRHRVRLPPSDVPLDECLRLLTAAPIDK